MTITARPRPASAAAPVQRPDEVGATTTRIDGVPKVKGEFEYSSDMYVEGMLWGATLRSPHPRADIWAIDIAAALAMPGVHAVLTHEDVPGPQGLRAWSSPTSRCSPGTTCATRASRSRSSPPTTPRRPAARPTRSRSTTRCSSR